jgi:hypothetical protein
MDMNGLRTKDYLNNITLGSYDCLFYMDWLENHHTILDCYNKAFNLLDEKGNLRTFQGIPREVIII